MGWAAIAQAIAGFFITYDKSQIQRASDWANNRIAQGNANAQNTINQANADAANLVRSANNDFQAAQAAYQNNKRSITNQQKLDTIGRQSDALEVNSARQIDAMVRGRLSTQLQAASTLGAIRAGQAARGVGGSSANMMRGVAALAAGSAETTFKDKTDQITYDTLLRRQGLVRTAALSQDLGVSLPNMDYGVNVAPLVQAPIYIEQGSALRDAVRGALGESGSLSSVSQFGGSSSPGVSTNWYSVGSNSATNYGPSYGFAQGNGQDYGLNAYLGVNQGTYNSGGLQGVFSGAGGGGASSGGGGGFSGWFTDGGGSANAGGGDYFSGA